MSAGGNVSPAAWIEDCLMREYDLLELLSQKETGEVSLWQHRALGPPDYPPPLPGGRGGLPAAAGDAAEKPPAGV